MKASLNIKAFSNAIAIASRANTGKATMPVLACILLSASQEDQRVYMTCTNLDVRITTSLKANVEEPGEICVNSSLFTSIIRALPSEEVEITSTKFKLKVTAGGSKFQLHSIDASEFPPAPGLNGELKESTFSQEDLLARFTSVAPAQSDDGSRYILNGLYLDQKKTGLKFAATDGRRLHVNTSTMSSEEASSLILPASTVAKLMSLLGAGKDVKMTLANRWVGFVIDREEGRIEVHSKVVEGAYPQYERVIPSDYDKDTISVDRDGLAQALRRVSLSLSEKSKSVRITLKGNQISLNASSPELGEANEEIACENPKGIEAKLAVNPVFVIEALTAVTEEKAIIKVTNDVSPLVLTIGDLLTVIMPIRLS